MRSILHNTRFRRVLRRSMAAALTVMAVAAVGFVVLWLAFPLDRAALYRIPAGVTWCDRGGVPLRVRLAEGGIDSIPGYVHREDDWIAKAVVAAEDRRFWSHHGVDPLAVARSCRQTATAWRRVSGASTLSMQVIRMSFPKERTLANKMTEAFRALQMESELGKDEILSLYLNRAPFGSNVVGIEAAARRYFSKGAHDLTLAEASLLAGIPQSPTRFNPLKNPAAAAKRQRYVLDRMEASGMITAEQKRNALAMPLGVRPNRYPFLAPHFCDMLVKRRTAWEPTVATSLDLALQRAVEESVGKYAPGLAGEGIHGAAVVVIDVRTGGVRALVGSPDFHARTKGSQVNAANSPRSAGSTLKPFVYALGFERGSHTPARVLYDVPEHFSDYTPLNFDRKFRGVVSLRDSLVQSLNLPAIEVERAVGLPRFHEMLRRLGLRSIDRPTEEYGLGLVLGNAEVTLLDLTNAYVCLARGGVYLPWHTGLSKPDGATEVISAEAAWMISDILGGDERAMFSTGTVADIRIPRLAWKTGTSSGFRDAWTIAYNPDYAIGVWLGNPNGHPSQALLGRRAAAPVVWDICRRLYPDGNAPWFPKPSGVEAREVCAVSGGTPCPNCPRAVADHAIRGVTRYQTCEVHRFGRDPVWPPQVADFLRSSDATATDNGGGLAISSPADGSAYLFVRDANPRIGQRIPLTATAADATSALHWFVDDTYLGESRSGETIFWPLSAGTHRIVCSDSRGASRSVRITVREPKGSMAGKGR